MGFGVFNLLLAAIGLYVIWKEIKQITLYTLLLILILASFYFNYINLYLNFILTFFAGFGFFKFRVF